MTASIKCALTKLHAAQIRHGQFGGFDTEADTALQGYLAKAVSGLPNPYTDAGEVVAKLEWLMFDEKPGCAKAIAELAELAFSAYNLIHATATQPDRHAIAKKLWRIKWQVAGQN